MAFAAGQSSVAQPISLFTLPAGKHTVKFLLLLLFLFGCVCFLFLCL